eukprot:300591-Prorocentrum_minimum.AAC.1
MPVWTLFETELVEYSWATFANLTGAERRNPSRSGHARPYEIDRPYCLVGEQTPPLPHSPTCCQCVIQFVKCFTLLRPKRNGSIASTVYTPSTPLIVPLVYCTTHLEDANVSVPNPFLSSRLSLRGGKFDTSRQLFACGRNSWQEKRDEGYARRYLGRYKVRRHTCEFTAPPVRSPARRVVPRYCGLQTNYNI